MDHFTYRNGTLYAEDVSITEIAATVGPPFYCYSSATLTRHYTVFADAFTRVPTTLCFAVKANSNLAVLRLLAKLGSGADAVSEGEIRRAIAAGIPAAKIVFSGVGKTPDEMRYALEQHIGQFNVESRAELEQLNQVALSMNLHAPIALRVNPDVDANTHDKISTGRKEDKFGIEWDKARSLYALAGELKGIKVMGISTHIGSQLTSLDPFQQAFHKVAGLVETLRADGHTITRLDLGGGLGIPYSSDDTPPSPADYASMVIDTTQKLGCELIFEPGRLITGNAGILISKVIYHKLTSHKDFLVIDAAMNDLMRPALYGSHHDIIPVIEPQLDATTSKVDVVGPICETTDIFCKDRPLPPIEPEALIAFRSAGAYGAVMSNEYNSRLLVPEVLVNQEKFAIIRDRPSYDEMLARDNIPEWI